MPIALSLHSEPGFLRASAHGHADANDFQRAVGDIASRTHGQARLLVDLRDVEQTLDAGDLVFLAEHAVIAFAHLDKVASLVPQGKRKGVTESVAEEQGLALRTFTVESDAIEWLLAG